MAGTAGGRYHPRQFGLCYWTIDRGKGLASRVRTDGRGRSRSPAGSYVRHGVINPDRELSKGPEWHFTGNYPGTRGDGSTARVPCAEIRPCQDLLLPDISQRDLFSICHPVCLALSIST